MIVHANEVCVGLLWATVWAGRSERAGTCLRCSHGSVHVHDPKRAACVLTVHGHTFENESFLFISYSCSSNPYFLYYRLIGAEDWSLRLNEFHLRAIAGCSFLNLPRNQTSPPSDAAQQTPASELPLQQRWIWIIHYRRLFVDFLLESKQECDEGNTKKLIYMSGSLRFCLRGWNTGKAL